MNYGENWVEIISAILMIIGFMIGIFLLKSLFMFYIIIFLSGLIFGRLWYRVKRKYNFPWILIIAGFLLGLVISAYILDYKISIIILILIFFLALWVSYYVHETKKIRSIEY